MGRSEDAEAFFAAVYEAVQEIPRGRVTTYAHIARLVGKRTSLAACTLEKKRSAPRQRQR